MRHADEVAKAVDLLLFERTVVDNDSVFKVAAFDKTMIEELLDFANKYECAC